MFENLGIDLEKKVFHRIYRVSAPGLQQPDLLPSVYLGLLKHLMDLIVGPVKTHARLQAFEDIWKVLPPYLRFFVPKKACHEVTQWQLKEMRNLGWCLLGVLAIARLCYGADWALKNLGPRPFSPPRPTQGPRAGSLFRHSLPLFPLRPLPYSYPRRVPVKNRW